MRPDSTADRAMLERYRETVAEMAGLQSKVNALLDRLAELDPPCSTPPR